MKNATLFLPNSAAHTTAMLTLLYGTTKEKIRVAAQFGLIAAVTPIIEIYQKLYALLGERFLTVRRARAKQKFS